MRNDKVETSSEMALDAMPGGNQIVLNCLPEELKACLQRTTRVVLVANNPAIT